MSEMGKSGNTCNLRETQRQRRLEQAVRGETASRRTGTAHGHFDWQRLDTVDADGRLPGAAIPGDDIGRWLQAGEPGAPELGSCPAGTDRAGRHARWYASGRKATKNPNGPGERSGEVLRRLRSGEAEPAAHLPRRGESRSRADRPAIVRL
ncbi:hypothetical protein [Streptomyces fradiae]|uniref:hypothetical protein n=1 Tax=Streptomyces fradiae TaxID=1906 RepID=UPI003986B14C